MDKNDEFNQFDECLARGKGRYNPKNEKLKNREYQDYILAAKEITLGGSGGSGGRGDYYSA